MTLKLTKSLIDQFRYAKSDGKQDIRWDSQITGLGVRIYPSGKKSFVVAYRVSGRKRIMTIGRYGVLTIDQAREEAVKTLAHIINGRDPLCERQAALNTKTMRDFSLEYLKRHAKPHNKSWNKVEGRLKRHIVPAFGSKLINSISRNDIALLHNKLSQKAPYEANRVVELLSSMFERAREWGYVEGDNPARKIKKNREKKRDRWITPDELPRLIKAISEEENIYARNAILLYLYTGLRKSELLNAKWEDLDWPQKTLRIPETKADRVHYVPLSEPAMDILRALPPIEGNQYILAGRNPGAPIINLDKPWFRIREAAGLSDVRLHDLRRTVGSWLAQQGNSLHLIGRVLNHSSPKTTQVYAHFAEAHVRAALEAHAEKLTNVVKKAEEETRFEQHPKPPCKVIPMRPKLLKMCSAASGE